MPRLTAIFLTGKGTVSNGRKLMSTEKTNRRRKLRRARFVGRHQTENNGNKRVSRAVRWAIPPAVAAVSIGGMLALGGGARGGVDTAHRTAGPAAARTDAASILTLLRSGR